MRRLTCSATFALLMGAAGAQSGAQVFSAFSSTSVILFQWTVAGGQLKGTAQVVSVAPTTSGINLLVTNSGITGTRSGSDYALTFDKPILGAGISSAPARLNQGDLLISIPSESGGLTDITLRPSTLPKFNAAVVKLKADAQASQQKQQNSAATSKLNGQIVTSVSHLSQYTKVLESAANIALDTANLVALSAGLDVQTRQIPVLDAADRCADLKALEDLAVTQATKIQIVVGRSSDSLGLTGTAYDAVNDTLGFFDISVKSLQQVAPAAAKKATSDNAQLITRARAAVSRSMPQVLAARAAVDLSAARLQAFNDAVGNARCQFP